jgi:hypothetical protein
MKLSLSENTSSKMDRRSFLKYCAASCLMAGAAWAVEKKRNKRPNIVMILADDLGICDTGAFAKRFTGTSIQKMYYETPHLDRLVSEGMAFSQAYGCQLCSPTRASLLTGDHSHARQCQELL